LVIRLAVAERDQRGNAAGDDQDRGGDDQQRADSHAQIVSAKARLSVG